MTGSVSRVSVQRHAAWRAMSGSEAQPRRVSRSRPVSAIAPSAQDELAGFDPEQRTRGAGTDAGPRRWAVHERKT